MPAVATATDFLEVARKSNQIDNQRLEAFLARREQLPAEPRKLAAMLIREGLITTFQAEQFLLGKYKGFYLGGYRIVERIGAGGAGTVYLGEHQLMKRRAAIKVLPTALADEPAMLARFRIEAEAAASLHHPNVVHVFDFRQEGRLHYIIMEYVDGPNLQQLISRKGGLGVFLACEYVRQAALGLAHVHEAGLVHRDVKPANILVDSQGTVKVLDLGLARVERPDAESVTCKYNSNAVLGTADFLAPEQALNLHDVDARADVYGLGATFYSLLTGHPPFPDGTVAQKLMWHQTREPAEALVPWASQAPQPEGRSSRNLAEIRIGARTGTLAATSTARLLPTPAAPDTLTAQAQEDTAQIETKPVPESPVRDVTLGQENTGKKLLLLGGVVAGVLGLVAGVILFLLWGPRP
jgi:serine/threonine protein kinase